VSFYGHINRRHGVSPNTYGHCDCCNAPAYPLHTQYIAYNEVVGVPRILPWRAFMGVDPGFSERGPSQEVLGRS